MTFATCKRRTTCAQPILLGPSCSNQVALCPEAKLQPDTILEVRIGRESLRSDRNGLLDGAVGDERCLSIHAREIRGHRSEPAVACSDGGCTLSAEGPSSSFGWLASSAALAAPLLRLCRGRASGLGCALGLSVAGALAPAPARACTRAFPSITVSYPVGYSGEGVPTNAVLFADGPELTVEGFTLSDAAGNPVLIQTRAVEAGGFDIEPLAELAPNQAYVLSVPEMPGGVASSVSFHTDRGPAKLPDALFVPEWSPVEVAYTVATCSNEALFCTGAHLQPDTMLEVRIGRESLTGGPEGAVQRALGGGLRDDECMSVRARDIRGHRSEPAIACGEAIRYYDAGSRPSAFYPDCTAIAASFAEPAAPDDLSASVDRGVAPVSTDVASAQGEAVGGGGCALQTDRGTSTSSWLALGTALAALSRRRSHRTP